MSEVQFPATYRSADGVELTARDDVQAHVFQREGFELVVEDKPAKKPAGK